MSDTINALATNMVVRKHSEVAPYILFLGAGASATSGCSIMVQIIDDVLKTHDSTQFENIYEPNASKIESFRLVSEHAGIRAYFDDVQVEGFSATSSPVTPEPTPTSSTTPATPRGQNNGAGQSEDTYVLMIRPIITIGAAKLYKTSTSIKENLPNFMSKYPMHINNPNEIAGNMLFLENITVITSFFVFDLIQN